MTTAQNGSRYSEMRNATRVKERALFLPLRIPNELELQARWFAGEFGKSFLGTNGDKIDIIQFGIWNREAGPDFKDSAVSVNGSEPRRGCIEIDLVDRNWETHGHSTNPAFDQTVLHVFVEKSEREFFTRTKSNRNVPQVRIDPATLPEAFSANIPLARPGRCQAPLGILPEDRVRSVLDAAAQFRLQKKAARIRAKIENCQSGSDHGRDEALFQEIAAALGYKENKLPFTLIAQRLSLKALRKELDDAEAILFGIAGLLETPDLAIYKKSAKNYVRELWDRWWPHRDRLQRLILPSKIWKLSSTRPVNHPQRRLAALAILVQEWPAFRRSLGKVRAGLAVVKVQKFFETLDHPFWKFHYTMTADGSLEPMALVGESRVADILANVIFPFWRAEDADPSIPPGTSVWPEYAKLPARLTNRRLETAATRLFGDGPRRREFTKTIAHQQALLQIYEDFCLQDNTDCANCPFPEQMAKWK
jgi:hypothetical protein